MQQGRFQYQQLIDFTAGRMTEAGLPPIHQPIFIIDINLLDTCLPDDRNDIKVEEDFFSNAPELGIFTLWSTFGNHIDARQLHPSRIFCGSTSLRKISLLCESHSFTACCAHQRNFQTLRFSSSFTVRAASIERARGCWGICLELLELVDGSSNCVGQRNF